MPSRERTGFVTIYALMQAEARVAELIYLISVFDIVANLVFDHSGRIDKSGVLDDNSGSINM